MAENLILMAALKSLSDQIGGKGSADSSAMLRELKYHFGELEISASYIKYNTVDCVKKLPLSWEIPAVLLGHARCQIYRVCQNDRMINSFP